jgi:hypothetical protein
LETNENCLIKHFFPKIEVKDSLIFLLDNDAYLFVFDMDGKFITQIGKHGYGPDEYLKINTFYFEDNNVVIVDEMKNSLIKYDFKGKFLSYRKIPLEFITKSGQAIKTEDNKLLLFHAISGLKMDDNMACSLIDLKELDLKYFSHAPIKLNNYIHYFSNHPMAISDKGINLILPLCDTVYNYYKSSFSTKYVVETQGKMATRDQLGSKFSIFENLIDLGNKGYFTGFTNIFETTKHIFLGCAYNGIVMGYFLCDKKTKQGYYYYYHNIISNEIIPFNNIQCAFGDNVFVGVSQPEDLLREDWNVPGETGVEFKKLLSSLREDDNPVLFFYKLKD